MADSQVGRHQSVTDELACALYEDLARKVRGDQKISETIRKQLWPVETTRVHTRNASWTLLYWSMLANAPDPLTADFANAVLLPTALPPPVAPHPESLATQAAWPTQTRRLCSRCLGLQC